MFRVELCDEKENFIGFINNAAKGKPTLGEKSLDSSKCRPSGSLTKTQTKKFDSKEKAVIEWTNYMFSKGRRTYLEGSEDGSTCSDGAEVGDGLRAVARKKSESEVYRAALALFHSSALAGLPSLQMEIAESKLLVREDRDVLLDLGLRDSLFSILFSYELPWLRLGLEIVFGGIISAQHAEVNGLEFSSSKHWQSVLRAFVVDRMLHDEGIYQFHCRGKLMTLSSERTLQSKLRKHFALKLLSVILFLDQAREARILALDTLFLKTSSLKSSKDALLAVCRNFLRGEGDFIRHLSGLGCNASFTQTFIHEFDFCVSDLNQDFRDGVRLSRLAEILTGRDDTSSKHLRVPAISRLQKLHNVGVALSTFETSGRMRCCATAKDIVDGNKEKTIALLLQAAYVFALCMHLSPRAVLLEAANVRRNASWRRTIYTADIAASIAVKVSQKNEDGSITHPFAAPVYASLAAGRTAEEMTLMSALMEWADSISSQYGVSIADLHQSLGNGKALCLLVHYYHPSILPTPLIHKTTRDYAESDGNELKGVSAKALEGERRNVGLVLKACASLGEIPPILPKFDSTSVPDERLNVLFLGFLFSRLVESSRQVASAIRLQRAVRFYLFQGRDIVYPCRPPSPAVIPRTSRVMNRFQNPRETSNYVSVSVSLTSKQTAAMRIVAFLNLNATRRKELKKQAQIAAHVREESRVLPLNDALKEERRIKGVLHIQVQ